MTHGIHMYFTPLFDFLVRGCSELQRRNLHVYKISDWLLRRLRVILFNPGAGQIPGKAVGEAAGKAAVEKKCRRRKRWARAGEDPREAAGEAAGKKMSGRQRRWVGAR